MVADAPVCRAWTMTITVLQHQSKNQETAIKQNSFLLSQVGTLGQSHLRGRLVGKCRRAQVQALIS